MSKQKKKSKRFNKRLYIYMAFVTMAAVSLFAKPFKKGLNALSRRLKRASQKDSLRAQLELNQQNFSPLPDHLPENAPVFKRKGKRSR